VRLEAAEEIGLCFMSSDATQTDIL